MVDEIIKQIHQGKMIDDMTKKYQYSEYQSSISSRKYTNLYRSVDL